jgi:hypothetical protein
VTDPVTAKVVTRTVTLAQAPASVRPRLLALAVAELVAASWEEVASQPVPAVPPAAPPPEGARASVLSALAARRRPSEAALSASADARVFFASGLFVYGAEARATVHLGGPLRLRLAASADYGTASRSLGVATALMAQASAGAGWAVGDALFWVGGTAGVARVEGQPHPRVVGGVQSGPWAGPEAGADLTLWSGAPVEATLGAVVGAALLGVRGDVQGETSVAVQGAWAGLRLGVQLSKP